MSNISQIYDVDLKLLRCFCTIVEEKSFTAAQAVLNLSQSTLSENLKSLEIRLGTRLCRRGPKGFKLFREGEAVYQAAKELFASVETFKQKASNINQSTAYELSIGIQDGIVENPSARIHDAIRRFSEYYPNVRFRMEVMLGFQLTGRVADGIVHVGIGLVNDQFPQLTYEHLFDEQGYMFCSDKHPLFAVPDDELTIDDIESAAYCNRGHLEYYHPERTRHGVTCGDIGLGIQSQLALDPVGPQHRLCARPHGRAAHRRRRAARPAPRSGAPRQSGDGDDGARRGRLQARPPFRRLPDRRAYGARPGPRAAAAGLRHELRHAGGTRRRLQRAGLGPRTRAGARRRRRPGLQRRLSGVRLQLPAGT